MDPGAQPGSAPATVRATVTDTGPVVGAEVVQAYLGLPEAANQPPKRLVGFAKVRVEPGASAKVEIVVDPDATNHPLSVWSRGAHDFVVLPGEYTVYVGTSSDDTSERHTFAVSA